MPKEKKERSKTMKKYSFKWEDFLQLVLLCIGTYGERIFVAVHAFISNMKPELFSFICLIVTYIMFVKLTHSN